MIFFTLFSKIFVFLATKGEKYQKKPLVFVSDIQFHVYELKAEKSVFFKM